MKYAVWYYQGICLLLFSCSREIIKTPKPPKKKPKQNKLAGLPQTISAIYFPPRKFTNIVIYYYIFNIFRTFLFMKENLQATT